jgi:hypothetical protein
MQAATVGMALHFARIACASEPCAIAIIPVRTQIIAMIASFIGISLGPLLTALGRASIEIPGVSACDLAFCCHQCRHAFASGCFCTGRNSIKTLKDLAPRAGFEPATNRLTAGCSTAELPGNDGTCSRASAYNKAALALKAACRRRTGELRRGNCDKLWRPRPELNRGKRFCRPLRHHSATWPSQALPVRRSGRSWNPRSIEERWLTDNVGPLQSM